MYVWQQESYSFISDIFYLLLTNWKACMIEWHLQGFWDMVATKLLLFGHSI